MSGHPPLTIEQLLKHLVRTDVVEVALASGRLPCVKIEANYRPIDTVAPNTESILQMLVSVGGSRYVDSLSDKATHWRAPLDGVGTVAVAAVVREGNVQARFVLVKRGDTADATAQELAANFRPIQPSTSHHPPSEEHDPALRSAVVASRSPTTRQSPQAHRGSSLVPPARVPGGAGSVREIELGEDASNMPPISLDRSDGRKNEPPPKGTLRDVELGLPTDPQIMLGPIRVALRPVDSIEEYVGIAREAEASDMHIIADRPLLLRVAGDLHPWGDLVAAARVEEMARGLIPSRLREEFEVHGQCDFAFESRDHGRFRVNVGKQRTGIKICMRCIGSEIPTLESLGLPAELEKATHHHQGLIVVTGPTGHGKTSTLAALVDIINRGTTHHIITVEDPVEFVHPRKKAMMSQREVGSSTKSFANALKGALREDPDVIVVGELRDTETVRMALSASETGHLVLGSMNTPSAAKTIDRLIDLFPSGDQQQVRMTLAGGLRMIVSQRLVPSPDGRKLVAASELLPGSVPLWSLIRDSKTFQIPSLQQRGKGLGILRLDDSFAELVRAGKTTREAAVLMAENPEELDAVLSGKRAPPPPPAPNDPKGGLLGKAGSLFGGKKGP